MSFEYEYSPYGPHAMEKAFRKQMSRHETLLDVLNGNKGYWIDKNGNKHYPKDMSTSHLLNCVGWLERNASELNHFTQDGIKQTKIYKKLNKELDGRRFDVHD